jgi:ABC-type dipeptide/oligopeptide/nickel transport system ATPase component
MLKLLAIQVLKECEAYIMRCLKPGVMYYLCHDYDFSQSLGGIWTVCKRGANINTVDEKFFRIKSESSLNINVSAIVGENGSGKSSIVELILRMINNCSINFGITAEDAQLKYVEGVHARLFYQTDQQICCLCVDGVQESVSVKEIATIENNKILLTGKELTAKELKGHFFYTLVSNYSHYAYNTHDFKQEWNKQSDENSCWLKWLFHKNDGYQTPITLHPFRDQGTISIQREKNLSNQRLLYFFINYAKQNKSKGVFDYINGKRPKYLNLREVKESKLQQTTLLQYFDNHKEVNLLGEQIAYVKGLGTLVMKPKNKNFEEFRDRILIPLENLAYRILGLDKKEHSRHFHFYRTVLDWMQKEEGKWLQEHGSKLFSRNSDLKQLIDSLENMVANKEVYSKIQEICCDLKEFELLSLCQIQRLEILDDICDYWRERSSNAQCMDLRFEMKPEIIISEYSDLSQKEKCYHYIVYKTINIFETYPSYHYPIWRYTSNPVSFNNRKESSSDKQVVYSAFNQLLEDVTKEKTHITLKMRQAFYYLKHSLYNQNGKDGYVLQGEKIDNLEGICLSTERLSKYYENENEQNLETLPPPIYDRHLLFEAENGKLVDMDSFSSGEKQLLNTQSAIIYHLQNLNSIFKDPARMKYPQVNIILEEIELYFHPEYQRNFIYSLINLLELSGIDEHIKNVNILIVTHSPFILSDIPKSNVLFLKEGRQVTDMQENTFGANIHTMLQNAFFLNGVTIGDFARDRINRLFGKLHNDVITEDVYKEILLVSEPFIKSQLLKMYNERYPHHQMKEMEERIAELEKVLSNNSDDKN